LLFFLRIYTGTSSRVCADLGFNLNNPLSNDFVVYYSKNNNNKVLCCDV